MRIGKIAAFVLLVCAFGLPSRTDAAVNSARAVLNSVIPTASMKDVTFADAIQYIRDVTNADLVVEWKTLDAVNIPKDALINLNLRGVRVGTLLTMILNGAAGGSDVLTYYVDSNIIYVTTQAQSDAKLITVVYYVDDILAMNQPFTPQISAGGGLQPPAGSFSGSGSGNIGSAPTAQNANSSGSMTNAQEADLLITMIEQLIRPEVWRANGGNSNIEYFNGNLIIVAPRSVQEAIGGPLN